jgi:SAM-dependent methyltransferase
MSAITDKIRAVLWRLNGSSRVIATLADRLDEIREHLPASYGERLEMREHLPAIHDQASISLVAVNELLDRVADLEFLMLRHVVCPFRMVTDHPVAIRSDDHLRPRGTRNDNTRHPRFVRRTEELFDRSVLYHLDLGCAGGGLVLDFLLRGHVSVGVEGSDYSLREGRAEWRVIPGHLFTADVTEPFQLQDQDGRRAEFDIITAWELLEHLPRAALPKFFENVRTHLKPDGIFVASVATFEDKDAVTGAVYHVTIKPKEWWIRELERAGLEPAESPFGVRDYPRGSGNPRVGPLGRWDWDVSQNPELGFHVYARARTAT